MTVDFLAERIVPALSGRVWSFGQSAGRDCSVFLIGRGAATLARTGLAAVELAGPALVWSPHPGRGTLQVAPGSDGYSAVISATLLQRVASNPIVSAHRQPFLGRSLTVTSDMLTGRHAAIAASMQAMVEESRGMGAGSAAAVGLHLGLLILQVWRLAGLDVAHSRLGDTLVQRFTRLVEAHFRDGLRIHDYAGRLGISQAHLHECCLRSFGRTPLRILHERVLEEAKTILRHNEVSVEQAGFSLGFRDAGYFNRFFKRLTGETPGAYQRSTAIRPTRVKSSFAAWP